MKRMIILVLTAALLVSGMCLAEAAADPFIGRWQDPYYGRAVLEIEQADDRYDVLITWGSSADSEGVWRMDAARAGDSIVYTGGSMSMVTYSPEGAVIGEEVQYDDAEGAFTLSGDGRLLWADSREDRASEFAFERVPAPVPTADDFKTLFFESVARQTPGAAGASLKLAETVAGLADFIDEYRIWDADPSALRETMLEGWAMLDDSARRRFEEDFTGVAGLMDGAMSDYDSVAGLFSDVGAEYMADRVRDENIRTGWQALTAAVGAMNGVAR